MSDALTKREIEVVTLIARGLSTREIATHRYRSIKTIEGQRLSAMRKLEARTTAQLTLYAVKQGWVSV